MLDFACFVDPGFKSMPFLDTNKKEALQPDFLAEVTMYVIPGAEQQDERPDSDSNQAD